MEVGKTVIPRAFTAFLVLLPASPALADPAPGEGFDVTSYELALTPDIQNGTVAGRSR